MEKKLLRLRMKEERKKLGMTQEAIASKVAVTRETWSRYETGKMKPGLHTWLALFELGCDVYYILTGRTIAEIAKYSTDAAVTNNDDLISEESGVYQIDKPIDEQELALLTLYRKADAEQKQLIENMIKLLISTPK